MRPPALVIGSGFGGIAAAIRLQARGYAVTILEMGDQPGGRACVFEDKGFVYDAGPTIITAPFLIDELFELAGKRTADYVPIVPVTPYYRIVFPDGRRFDYTGDEAEILAQIRKFNPADTGGYLRFAEKSRAIFDRAFLDLADRPFSSVMDMIKVAPDLVRLRSHESVYRLVSRYVKDPLLRQVFSFHPLLVGGNPFQSSSIYAMIHYLERKWGVHFAMGGTGALVRALLKLFAEMGGQIRLNCRVEELLVTGGTATGVRLASGEELDAALVVSNADVARFYKKAVPAAVRKTWTDARLDRMRYSMGLFPDLFRNRPDLPGARPSHHRPDGALPGTAGGYLPAQDPGRRFFALSPRADAYRSLPGATRL